MKKVFAIAMLLAGLLSVQPALAQTTINATTLGAAITDVGDTGIINLVSIGSGATAVLANQTLFIDGEAMRVQVTPTAAARVQVARHTNGTRGQTHVIGSIVYYGPNQAFVSGTSGVQFYQGSCTSSNYLYLPVIDTVNATIGNCLDSRWSWTKITAPAGISVPHHAVTGAYTVKITDYIIGFSALAAAATVTLPAADGLPGKVYIVRNESAVSSITIWVTAGDNIDGSASSKAIWGTGTSATSPLSGVPSGVMRFYSNGTAWFTW